jgi:Flp pilus assembly protein TadG
MSTWFTRFAPLSRDCGGTAALEFAAAAITIMILLLAIFDIGMLYLTQRGLDFGVNKAARWASVNSASVTASTVLTQFKNALSPVLGSASQNCLGYNSGDVIPPGTTCYVTLALSNGAQVGSLVTISASYAWVPLSTITGFRAATLQSSAALTIQN